MECAHRGWGTFALVALNAGQEIPLRVWIAPRVSLELPAPYSLHQGCEIAMLAGIFKGCV